MSDAFSLKATLKRGALVTGANWPVVLVQFVAESTFKLLLGVPMVGGAVLVALALGWDLGPLLQGDARDVLARVAAALTDHPRAFAGFGLSLAVMVIGGSALMFLVKGGTVAVLAAGERQAGPIEAVPLRLSVVQGAAAFSLSRFTGGCVRLFPRYLRLGMALLAVYGLSGAAYLAVVLGGARAGRAGVALTGTAAAASLALAGWITLVNLAYLLLQMVVALEDCSVRKALPRVTRFLRATGREVALVFGVVLGLFLLATVASLLATAGLGLISFVPFVGLAVFPLQAAAWLVRGLVFQYLGLTALGAYLALYRRAGVPDAVPANDKRTP